jgi:hypothetical protein
MRMCFNLSLLSSQRMWLSSSGSVSNALPLKGAIRDLPRGVGASAGLSPRVSVQEEEEAEAEAVEKEAPVSVPVRGAPESEHTVTPHPSPSRTHCMASSRFQHKEGTGAIRPQIQSCTYTLSNAQIQSCQNCAHCTWQKPDLNLFASPPRC